MPLIGGAFLALYNDFDPARDDEYNRWHSREHVPQRLSVPGIERARRYVDRVDPRFPYFTLYEMASAQTMQSPPYLHLLDHPTPWSARMRPGFRQFLRVPCRTLASAGDALGGCVATVVCEGAEPPAHAAAWMAACDQLAALDGIVAVHAGQQDAQLRGPAVAAAQALSARPTSILLVEAQERRWLALQRERIEAALHGMDLRATDWRAYDLMEVVTEGRQPQGS